MLSLYTLVALDTDDRYPALTTGKRENLLCSGYLIQVLKTMWDEHAQGLILKDLITFLTLSHFALHMAT